MTPQTDDKTEKEEQQRKSETDEPTKEEDWVVQRDESKAAGDAAFRLKDYAVAIQHYTEALSMDPENGKILSNRSAAYLANNEKSKALHDAVACVKTGDMGVKGISRHAAALQALGRHGPALEQWQAILKQEPKHAAALKGKEDCEKVLEEQKRQEEEEAEKDAEDEEADDLDDFFNDVEDAVETVTKEKELEAQPVSTEAIKKHKKDLGTAAEQIERLLPENYFWFNLNPFHVLDISHTAPVEEISRRYKALSLLLHPDRNSGLERAQLAYDQVLAAKAALQDADKANHVRQLVEQGMIQGKADWERSGKKGSLEDCQDKAVKKIFAEIEHKRRQVEKREREFKQREQKQEDAAAEKEKNERVFDKNWRNEERVDKRIGNWRDFQTKKKKKT